MRGKTRVSNDVLDVYGKEIGAYGFALYLYIARHRCLKNPNKITLRTMADGLGISPGTVCASLRKLREVGLVGGVSVHDRSGFVYAMLNRRNGYTKIGFSVNPVIRERTLQAEDPDTEIIAIGPGTMKREREIQKHFDVVRVRGEWFSLDSGLTADVKAMIGGGR